MSICNECGMDVPEGAGHVHGRATPEENNEFWAAAERAFGGVSFDCEPGHALKIEPVDTVWNVTIFEGKELTEADGPTFRSCWECNSAHEHLRSVVWLVCIGCGKTFKLGVEQ